MKTLLCTERTITYDGTQLAPHWIYRTFGVAGDALVVFTGEASVPLEHMVDLEDVRKKAPIYSPKMLHFVGEWFRDSLDWAILLQHLFVGEIYETLLEKGIPRMSRRGNDMYVEGRKLSVSIATRSLTSVLVHIGVNIETEGTPVPTSGLSELGLNPQAFAQEIIEKITRDYQIWQMARVKVSPR